MRIILVILIFFIYLCHMNEKIIQRLKDLSIVLQKAADSVMTYERHNYTEKVKELDTTLGNADMEAHIIMGIVPAVSNIADTLYKIRRNCCAVRNVYTKEKRIEIEKLDDSRFEQMKEHIHSWIDYYAEDLKREISKLQ